MRQTSFGLVLALMLALVTPAAAQEYVPVHSGIYPATPLTDRALELVTADASGASGASRQEPRANLLNLEPWVLGAMVTASGLDLESTARCLGARTCEEGNPALKWLTDTPLALGVVKMGVTAALAYVVHKLYHLNPTVATIVGAGLTGGWAYLAVRNTRATR